MYVGRIACLRRNAVQSTSSTLLAQPMPAPCYGWHCLWFPGQMQCRQRSWATSPKEWVNSACRCAELGQLHVAVVSWLPFDVNVQARGCNGSWPMFLASFLPINVLHDKTFPCATEWEGRGRGRRCLERCRDGWESALHGPGCNFTSCSAVNYTLWGGGIWMVQTTKSGRKQMLFKGSGKPEGRGTCMEKCFYTQHRTWWSLIDLWSMLAFL